ncbi:3233_t:CDS:2 [Acaulospora morrowiae]|uniref:3233_t:CDS:1 n=1 Tax=Acaulospora morrowiae TaxID=94023 RepID=A0A9N9DUB0_9GLOM|nr:3233_t:CDS:2 [Acaulospora morrowiae]
MVSKLNRKVEGDTLRWFSLGIWGFSIVYNIAILLVTKNQRQLGVTVTWLYCKCADLNEKWYVDYVYLAIISVATLINLIFGVHSTYILYVRWSNFKNQPNRHTAINLGHAVRVAIYINTLLALLLTYFLSDLLTPKNISQTGADDTIYVGDFASALSGTLLFLIFGTTRSATMFLPCCYYSQSHLYLPNHENGIDSNTMKSNVHMKVDICKECKEEIAERDLFKVKEDSVESSTMTHNRVDRDWLMSKSKKINSVMSVTNTDSVSNTKSIGKNIITIEREDVNKNDKD